MFAVSTAASYGFWLGGSFRDGVSLSVDGRRVGSARDQLNEPAQLTPLGAALLSAGRHDLELQYGGIGLRPGSRGAQFALGPMVMGTPAAEARLVNVPPAKAMSLCDKRLDWIEALGP
jgi:hypothetical protein